MVGENVLCHIKPEFRHLGQDSTLLGDLIFQNDIKAADAVGCNHNQAVAVVINLTNLAFLNRLHNSSTHFVLPRYPDWI